MECRLDLLGDSFRGHPGKGYPHLSICYTPGELRALKRACGFESVVIALQHGNFLFS
jgi:hypothetical protein